MFCCRSYSRPALAIVFAAAAASIAVAQTPSTGVRARPAPTDYTVSRQISGVTYAASLLAPDQVKHLFPVDISKTYLVFEVACYPSPSGDVTLNPNNFLVKSTSEYVHPSDAVTIASLIQDKNTPPAIPTQGPRVITAASVGYESGPGGHNVYTSAGATVTNEPDIAPPPPPRHGSSPQDRQALENQLADKALPQGTFHSPIAGYLYFVADALRKGNGTYNLQLLNDDGSKVDLLVPNKRK